jgi:large subunit ribosomal protein L4
MATVSVVNWDKKKIGELDLPEDVFGLEVRKDILHAVVRWQLACRRQGNHMTKTKGLVSGGGKKPFKQKGTGNARQGSTRSPLMPGGGTMFGPQPRDYSYVLPRKVKQLGLKTALSYLLKEGKLIVIDELKSSGKTAELLKNVQKLGLQKVVLIDGDSQPLTARASRNLPKIRYYSVEGINVYDLLKYGTAVVSKSSIPMILKRCGVEG